MVTDLLTSADIERARTLLAAQGLAFEPRVDDLLGLFERGQLVGVGARAGDVLKTIALAAEERGGAALGLLVTELVRRGRAAGHDGLFVFTRPAAAGSFEALGFELLASGGRAALLEHGGGLARFLDACRAASRPGESGAVVMNANPFTLGHRHLVEVAARAVDTLHVLVVREDRSAFPFEVRLRLVREGTADLANVSVLDTSRYAVSAVTFPAYFLEGAAEVVAAQAELDLLVFARRIAPALGVTHRFFGEEPLCETTRAYNAAMRRMLPRLGVAAVEIPRATARGAPISASTVRRALREGDLAGALALVPETTAAYLRSDAARAVLARLRTGGGRHA